MWSNPQESADLVTFTREICNKKLHFLCSVKIDSSRIFLYLANGSLNPFMHIPEKRPNMNIAKFLKYACPHERVKRKLGFNGKLTPYLL